MESLVNQLIEKHKLDKNQAVDAIRLVADYLKSMHPGLHNLIEQAIDGDGDRQTGSQTGSGND